MSPRKPRSTILTPEVPARSTGRPLGSAVKWALPTGVSSNCGVPDVNASFKVSPVASAATMAVEGDCGPGHDDEAAPDVVHVSATWLGEGCPAVVGVEAPQPESSASAKVSRSRRIVFLWNAAPTS